MVADPLAALLGTERIRKRNAALMVLVWESLGFKLTLAKGQLAQEITWIDGTIRSEPNGVRAGVKSGALQHNMSSSLELYSIR